MKKRNIVIILLMFIINLNAQKTNRSGKTIVKPDWIENYASTGFFILSDIEIDSDGNVYTSGTFKNELIDKNDRKLLVSANKNIPYQANGYFLMKHNYKGELLWVRTASGKSRAHGIELDFRGNIYTIGEVFSKKMVFTSIDSLLISLDKPNTNSSRGIFICKYSPSGEVIATKFFSQGNREVPKDFKIDKHNNLYIGGNFFYNQGHEGKRNYLLAKFDNNLDLIWIKKGDANGRSKITSVAIDKKGDVCVTGGYHVSIKMGEEKLILKHDTQKAFVAKFSNNGVLKWLNGTFDKPNILSIQEVGQGLVSDKRGNIYLAGTSFSKLYLAKFNKKGKLKWKIQSKGHSSYSGKILISKNKYLYIIGGELGATFLSSNKKEISLKSKNSPNLFIAKYNKRGKLMWLNTFGGSYAGRDASMSLYKNDLFMYCRINKITNRKINFGILKYLMNKFE